jgi:hypothetical protein
MAIAADGVVTVAYRPLTTMDELHALLLAAVTAESADPLLLAQVFSLPANVVSKELAVLEGYGLAYNAGGRWTATSRGRQVIAIRAIFCERGEVEVRATGQQWLLGPGDFSVDEMVRDMGEIETLARSFGVGAPGSAIKFLDERRKSSQGFEALLLGWPSRIREDPKHGMFGEALVSEHLKLAETDAALERLEELLATHIGEVVEQIATSEADRVRVNADAKAGNDHSVRSNAHDVMKKFEEARWRQRRQNQHLAQVKMTCEALLAGRWLAVNVASVGAAFNSEPGAFVFRSTVPLAEPEVPQALVTTRLPSPPPSPKPKQEEDGGVRALFRWLFG